MRGLMLVGIIMMVLGGVLMTMGYVKYRDTDPVVDLGKVEITKTETKSRRIPVAVSGALLGVGAVLTIAGVRKKG